MPTRVKNVQLLRRAQIAIKAGFTLKQFAREVGVPYQELSRELRKA